MRSSSVGWKLVTQATISERSGRLALVGVAVNAVGWKLPAVGGAPQVTAPRPLWLPLLAPQGELMARVSSEAGSYTDGVNGGRTARYSVN